MSITIKGMNLKEVLYLFKDAVARSAIADISTKMTVTQKDIDEICMITETTEGMEGDV